MNKSKANQSKQGHNNLFSCLFFEENMAFVPDLNNFITPLALPKLSTSIKEEFSLKHFSDNVVTGHIYTKHRDDDTIKIDISDYIVVIESIIATADQITEAIFQGKGRLIFSDDFPNVKSIDPPLCLLHHVSSELSCKANPGIEKAHQTTIKILNILSNYPWEAKAALTLTSFAIEYGIMWHLNHYYLLDPLAKSLSMVKRAYLLKRQFKSIKYRHVILSPNSLINSCLQALKCMNEIKKFSKYDIQQIPLITYWVIHVIVASRIEISCYLNDLEGQSLKYLNELTEKIISILNILENHLNLIREQ